MNNISQLRGAQLLNAIYVKEDTSNNMTNTVNYESKNNEDIVYAF